MYWDDNHIPAKCHSFAVRHDFDSKLTVYYGKEQNPHGKIDILETFLPLTKSRIFSVNKKRWMEMSYIGLTGFCKKYVFKDRKPVVH